MNPHLLLKPEDWLVLESDQYDFNMQMQMIAEQTSIVPDLQPFPCHIGFIGQQGRYQDPRLDFCREMKPGYMHDKLMDIHLLFTSAISPLPEKSA